MCCGQQVLLQQYDKYVSILKKENESSKSFSAFFWVLLLSSKNASVYYSTKNT